MPVPTYNEPYRNKPYMGAHTDDTAALTFIRAQRWDSAKDGTGQPEEAMWYFNTTDHVPRYWDSNAGDWLNHGTGAPTLPPDADGTILTTNPSVHLVLGPGTRFKYTPLNLGSGPIGIDSIAMTPHPPLDGTEIVLLFSSASAGPQFTVKNLTGLVTQLIDTRAVSAGDAVFDFLSPAPGHLHLRLMYWTGAWRLTSTSRPPL